MGAKRKFWIYGILLAAIGVLIARVAAGKFPQPVVQLVVYGVGTLVAFAGLGTIMYGTRKNLK